MKGARSGRGDMTSNPGDHTPRSAAVLLTDALDHLALVEPPALREPVRMMLRAGIEQCAISSSLLGKPVGHVLRMAQALVDEGHRREYRP